MQEITISTPRWCSSALLQVLLQVLKRDDPGRYLGSFNLENIAR